MWQYWELSLAEEFWPLSRQQVDGTIWRWQYSRAQFEEKLKQWSSGDPFYEAKAKKMYEGEFLSKGAVRRSILRILRGFAMLEAAVKEVRREIKSRVTAQKQRQQPFQGERDVRTRALLNILSCWFSLELLCSSLSLNVTSTRGDLISAPPARNRPRPSSESLSRRRTRSASSWSSSTRGSCTPPSPSLRRTRSASSWNSSTRGSCTCCL